MEKKFEDYFSELQADMISGCLKYVDGRAEKIFIYCSFEENVLSSGFFFKINGKIVKKNKLNDVITAEQTAYDVSLVRQKEAVGIINDNIQKLRTLCREHGKEMPTEIRLVYDVTANKVDAACSYELIYSTDKNKTAYDVLEEWYMLENKIINEQIGGK